MKKHTLLIDGDVFVYRAGLATERETDWGEGLWTLHADLNEAITYVKTQFAYLLQKLGADDFIVALSCPTEEGFRRKICPTYKGNRDGKRKPLIHRPLREWMIKEYRAVSIPTLEADDVLGILATEPTDDIRTIVSVDKDFSGVPCRLLRLTGSNPEVRVISEDEAARFHAVQALTGDKVDGYIGVPGCGPVSAAKLLEGNPTEHLWDVITKAYEKAHLSKEEALKTGRLAYILRHKDFNRDTNQLTLWEPKQLQSFTTVQSTTPTSTETHSATATASDYATPTSESTTACSNVAPTGSVPCSTVEPTNTTPPVKKTRAKRKTVQADPPKEQPLPSSPEALKAYTEGISVVVPEPELPEKPKKVRRARVSKTQASVETSAPEASAT